MTADIDGRFVRILHDWDKPSDFIVEGLSDAEFLSLKESDLLLVYETRDDGWSEAIIVHNHKRGWMPSNYCAVYNHEHTDLFFNAAAKTWLGSTCDSTLRDEAKQQTNNLAAGIRHMLKQTDCMRRGSPIIGANPSLDRLRKAMLAKLTELVKFADDILEEQASKKGPGIWNDHTDRYISLLSELCIRALRFMDVWFYTIDLPATFSFLNGRQVPRPRGQTSLQLGIREKNTSGEEDDPGPMDNALAKNGQGDDALSAVSALSDLDTYVHTSIERDDSTEWPSLYSDDSTTTNATTWYSISSGTATPELIHQVETDQGKFLRVAIEGEVWDFPVPNCYGGTDSLRYTEELTRDERGTIIGGTPWSLAMCLVYRPSGLPIPFQTTFLTFFHKFMTADDFARILIKQYSKPYALAGPPEQTRRRIMDVFEAWLTRHWVPAYDFDALDHLWKFMTNAAIPLSERSRVPLIGLLSSQALMSGPSPDSPCLGLDYLQIFCKNNVERASSVTQNGAGKFTKLLDISPTSLAEQLTYMTASLFSLITRQALIRRIENQGDPDASPVGALSCLSTDVTNFVIHSIVSTDNATVRQEVVQHWLFIGISCLLRQNYETVMAITAGLESTPVFRLHKTWAEVPADMKDLLKKLQKVTGTPRNFAMLREFLREKAATGLCIPFLGLMLRDMTFLNEAASVKCVVNGIEVVSIDKYGRLSGVMERVEEYQRRPHDLKINDEVQIWLKTELQQMKELREAHGNEGLAGYLQKMSKTVESDRQSQQSQHSVQLGTPSPAKSRLGRILTHSSSSSSLEVPKAHRGLRKMLSRHNTASSAEKTG